MENNKDSYQSANYHLFKASAYGIAFFFLLLGLTFLISKLLQSPAIGVIVWVLICSVPFIFQRKFKRAFSSKVDLLFDAMSITVKEYKSDGTVKETVIRWDDIKSYRFQFMQSDVTNLNIVFKTKATKAFFFIDEKYTNESPDEISIYSLFVEYVKMHNAGKSNDNKILTKYSTFSSPTPDL